MKTRDERQEESRLKWIRNKCTGTIIAPTGVGKTRIALNCIKSVLKRYPTFTIIVVVPTTTLKEQWELQLDSWGFSLNCTVLVINSAIKDSRRCDLLVLDEIHRFGADTFALVFSKIKYRIILGLTATLTRLDGKDSIIRNFCPVIDEITLLEAQINNWISNYKEYLVLLDVPDITHYIDLNREFEKYFEFFNRDFSLIMSLVGPKGYINRTKLRDIMCKENNPKIRQEVLKNITFNSARFMSLLQARKKFINNHPEKIRITREILEARKNSKIITFSNNIKMAESIGIGEVYSGKVSKKRSKTLIEDFNLYNTGVLNTIAKANEGLDIKGLSVAIILGLDSSQTKATQRRGRCIRFEDNKNAEIFNIVINNTVEVAWFKNSHSNSPYTTIDEEGLKQVLEGEEPRPYKTKLQDFMFRF